MSEEWPLNPRPHFVDKERTSVKVGDNMWVPWNAVNNEVLDVGGYAGRLWRQWQERDRNSGGSGEPDPYVPPPPAPLDFAEEASRCVAALEAVVLARKTLKSAELITAVLDALEHGQLDRSLCKLVGEAIRNRLGEYTN